MAESFPLEGSKERLLYELLGRDAPSEFSVTLGPLAVLNEIGIACDWIVGGGQAPQPRDRRSLRADAQTALHALGEHAKASLQPAFDHYLNRELKGLDSALDDAAAVLRLRASSKTLSQEISKPTCFVAAWKDLIAAVDEGDSLDQCRLRVAQLREFVESVGHNWEWKAKGLRARLRGDEPLSCEKFLANSKPQNASFAWFIFGNADIPSGYLRVGQVQFFSHRLWPGAVMAMETNDNHPDLDYPSELDDQAIGDIKPLDGADSHVYARVELVGPRATGRRNPQAHGQPPDMWARELVSGIVEAGTFRVGGTAWKLLAGTAIYSQEDGEWIDLIGFDDPALLEANSKFVPPMREGTGEALEYLGAKFADLLAEGDSPGLPRVWLTPDV